MHVIGTTWYNKATSTCITCPESFQANTPTMCLRSTALATLKLMAVLSAALGQWLVKNMHSGPKHQKPGNRLEPFPR